MVATFAHLHERRTQLNLVAGGFRNDPPPALDSAAPERPALDSAVAERPYWLSPFQNSSIFCPYLVGDELTVITELTGYLRSGVDTVILDIPASRDELERAVAVVRAAAAIAG